MNKVRVLRGDQAPTDKYPGLFPQPWMKEARP